VAAYRDAGGDPGDDALVAFYAAYRAFVRAKLACLAGEDAPGLVGVAERLRWRARLPLILVFCGVTGSGKSTVAERVAATSGLAVIGSDRVRKELSGTEPTARAAREHYGAEANRRTYDAMGTRAAACLRGGGGAIVDATFRRREERDAFAAALDGAASPVIYVECRAPRHVLLARARAREADPERVSDATAAMVDHQLAEWEPLDELPAHVHAVLRTDRDVAGIADDLEALLDRRLAAGEPPCA
jgi:predicted kinase